MRRTKSWRCAAIGVGLGVVAAWIICVVALPSAQESPFRKLPYLIYPGDPTRMSLLWETSAEQTTSVVVFGPDGCEAVCSTVSSDRRWRADVSLPIPSALYRYAVSAGDETVEGVFRAAPPPSAEEVTFYAVSDTEEIACGLSMTALIASLAGDIAGNAASGFLLHGGDWIQGIGRHSVCREIGSAPPQWDRLMGAMAPITARLPTVGVPGDLDVTGAAREQFSLTWPLAHVLDGAWVDGCWSLDFGPLHVTAVAPGDTLHQAEITSARALWMVRDVEAHRDSPWTVVLVHSYQALGPRASYPYLAGTRDALSLEMPGGWPWNEDTLYDVLSARGADLILSGHWHWHDLFAWDTSESPAWDGVGRLHELDGKLPILVLASAASSSGVPALWYRFDVGQSEMHISAGEPGGDIGHVASLVARP